MLKFLQIVIYNRVADLPIFLFYSSVIESNTNNTGTRKNVQNGSETRREFFWA